ncbi:TPA: hypothetical protein ACP2IA_004452 [Escherichia coli]
MTHQTHTIAESNNFIVLDKYIKAEPTGDSYPLFCQHDKAR